MHESVAISFAVVIPLFLLGFVIFLMLLTKRRWFGGFLFCVMVAAVVFLFGFASVARQRAERHPRLVYAHSQGLVDTEWDGGRNRVVVQVPHKPITQHLVQDREHFQLEIRQLKQQLREELAKVKAANEEAQEAREQAADASQNAEWLSELASKLVVKGDWKESLKEAQNYLNAIEGMEINIIENDSSETCAVTYDDEAVEESPAPEWVDQFVDRGDYEYDEDENIYRTMLVLGPFDSESARDGIHGEKEQKRELQLALAGYQAWFIATEPGMDTTLATRTPFQPSSRLLRHCIQEEFLTNSPTDNLPMKYVLVEFDEDMESVLRDHIQDCRSAENTAVTGLYGVLVLGILATLFGYLKIDEFTGGKRRMLLRVGAIGSLVVISFAYVLLANYAWVGL